MVAVVVAMAVAAVAVQWRCSGAWRAKRGRQGAVLCAEGLGPRTLGGETQGPPPAQGVAAARCAAVVTVSE